jgi:hypothetical protein
MDKCLHDPALFRKVVGLLPNRLNLLKITWKSDCRFECISNGLISVKTPLLYNAINNNHCLVDIIKFILVSSDICMGKQFTTHNRVVGCIFWIKVTFAALFACTGLVLMSWRVFRFHKQRLDEINSAAKPIQISSNNPACAFNPAKTRARLEIPGSGNKYIGFHLAWNKQIPSDVKRLLGFSPSV